MPKILLNDHDLSEMISRRRSSEDDDKPKDRDLDVVSVRSTSDLNSKKPPHLKFSEADSETSGGNRENNNNDGGTSQDSNSSSRRVHRMNNSMNHSLTKAPTIDTKTALMISGMGAAETAEAIKSIHKERGLDSVRKKHAQDEQQLNIFDEVFQKLHEHMTAPPSHRSSANNAENSPMSAASGRAQAN